MGVSSVWSVQALTSDVTVTRILNFSLLGTRPGLVIDSLSAFFILVISLTSLTSLLYSQGYLAPYQKTRKPSWLALHYFAFFWLVASMLLVTMIREGLLFLIVWEVMSVSSFILVIFESEKMEVLNIGIRYLIQMHIGLMFLLVAFLYASAQTGADLGFNGLGLYFNQYAVLPLFILFFLGFGIKAGFIPLHTWLPAAHPAAPSHVSALMSGVMIKMGIYGILRVLSFIHTDLMSVGIFITVISVISGLLGVIYAIVQHDLKKLLAYHSIENIGIIGIGIGIGTVGLAGNNPLLAFLGFTGGLLHILNHSLFKSLLFYSAGSVYQKTHTKYIERLGGLIKSMPLTAFLFLLASLAICGLPPFNGFVSELLIYSGAFSSLKSMDFAYDLLFLTVIVGLALIGGLAVFCFTKVFSIVFLGTPRSEDTAHASEVTPSMLFPQFLASFLILTIGIVPFLFVPLTAKAASIFLSSVNVPGAILRTLEQVGSLGLLFIAMVLVTGGVKIMVQKKRGVACGPTWGCAYEGVNAGRHQYTATSFADNHLDLLKPLFHVKKHFAPFDPEEIFPGKRTFLLHAGDWFEEKLLKAPIELSKKFFKEKTYLQSGQLYAYVLYALFFLVIIFFLTVLKLI